MGLDSVYYPRPKTSLEDLENFLAMLRYEKLSQSKFDIEHRYKRFSYLSNIPYESLQGVLFTICTKKKKLELYGRNNIWCNNADKQYHNYTLRELKKYFGGHFKSDYGRNRYFPLNSFDRKKDEAGCYNETSRALSSIQKLSILEWSLQEPQRPVQTDHFIWMNDFHPHVIFANIAISYILSVIESYFRRIYVVLLTFSDKKADLLKASQIKTSDLIEISEGTLRVEEAFANTLNFQGVKAICENFDRLDQGLGIRQAINKKHGRRKESFAQFIDRVAAHRHEAIHQNIQYLDYDLNALLKDARFCKILILAIYKKITVTKDWLYEEPY
jgi:hypothetical protein